MNNRTYFYLLVIFLVQFTFAEITLEDILMGISNRGSLIQSAKLDFSYEYYEPANGVFSGSNADYEMDMFKMLEFSYETLRLDKKVRVKQIENNLSTGEGAKMELVAWDGKVRTAYVENLTCRELTPGGTVNGEMGSFYSGYWPTAMEMWVFDFRKNLPELLEESSVEIKGHEKIGDYDAIKIKASNFFGDSTFLEVWIAPKKDFAPVKMHLLYERPEPAKDINLVMDNIKLEKKNGVWVIVESSICSINPNLSERLRGGQITKFKAMDYQVGIPIDATQFKIEFPKGTNVYDGIIQQGYIAGEGLFAGDSKAGYEYIPFVQDPGPNDQEILQRKIQKTISENNNSQTRIISQADVSGIETVEALRDVPASKSSTIYVSIFLFFVAILGVIGFVLFKRSSNA